MSLFANWYHSSASLLIVGINSVDSFKSVPKKINEMIWETLCCEPLCQKQKKIRKKNKNAKMTSQKFSENYAFEEQNKG